MSGPILIFVVSTIVLAGTLLFFLLTYTRSKKEVARLSKDLVNYNSIIDQANDAMLVIDIVDGRIHQANPSAARMLGYNIEDLMTISLFNLHPAEYLDKSSRIVADVWEKGGYIFDDVPFLTKSGELIPVECSAKVAPFAGRPAIVIYARDITERLRLEREINEQRKEIDEKSKDIRDSIDYSKRIQRSIFVEKDKLQEYVPESFVLFQPKDIVSGDFYWFVHYMLKNEVTSEAGNVFKKGSRVLVVAAADCTGHGVPGAFMSIIGNTLLNQTVSNPEIRSPARALDYVNAELKKILNRNSEDTPLRDGMDIALCSINLDENFLEFAGANNPIYIVRGSELIVLDPDKQAITASTDLPPKPFTNQTFRLQKNDCIYLFTDGYADQFGGEKEKKFLYKRFKETFVSIHALSMEEQKKSLRTIFEKWKGRLSQVDDVLVIGIKIT